MKLAVSQYTSNVDNHDMNKTFWNLGCPHFQEMEKTVYFSNHLILFVKVDKLFWILFGWKFL